MDKFVVLSMTKESKKIAKALSNETAINILNRLAEKRSSATELANFLNLPISTVQYNLDLLKQAKLIKDTAYRYSEKGKKVLYYEPAKQMVILAPEKEKKSVLNLLQDKILIPVILGLAAAIGFASQFFTKTRMQAVTQTIFQTTKAGTQLAEIGAPVAGAAESVATEIGTGAATETFDAAANIASNISSNTTQTITNTYHPISLAWHQTPGFYFFAGALFVVVILVIIYYYRRFKK